MQDYTEKYRHIIVPIIVRYAPNVKIILYGSRARKDFKEGADIDVALDAGSRIASRIMANILADIEESLLPICYDIVDFHELSASMQQEILKEGVIWKE
jgi:predicted nucleotidyltransferase